MNDSFSVGDIFESIGKRLNLPSIIEVGQHFQKREKWIADSEAWLEETREREAVRKSEPDRFYRWSHE